VDRLGRNYQDVTDTIRKFIRRGVIIRTVINKTAFDGSTKDPMRQAVRDALITFMAATALAQAEATKEAQRAGILHAQADDDGTKFRGRKPTFNWETFTAVQQLLGQGVGVAEVAKITGLKRQTDPGRQAAALAAWSPAPPASGSESASDGWLPMQNWLLKLRRLGVAVLIIHHAGVNGWQRGTSRREDALDTVIALRRPADYSPEQGARFEVHIEKARMLLGDGAVPFEAVVEPFTTEGSRSAIRWLARDLKPSIFEQAAALFQEGRSVRQVKTLLAISHGEAGRLRLGAVAEGLLDVGPQDGDPKRGRRPFQAELNGGLASQSAGPWDAMVLPQIFALPLPEGRWYRLYCTPAPRGHDPPLLSRLQPRLPPPQAGLLLSGDRLDFGSVRSPLVDGV
jgi:hypothetical protein